MNITILLQKTLIIVLWGFLIPITSWGQCSGNITLHTQSEVDDFSCALFEGNLTITGTEITNLNGLSELQEVTGALSINSTGLTSLNSLGNLKRIGTNLYIGENENLVSVSFPELKVTDRGYLRIENNASLEGFSFPNLERIGFNYISGDSYANRHLNHGLRVYRNHVLKNIDGFPKLGSVSNNFYIIENNALESINGFPLLEKIGRHFYIKTNIGLVDIEGFSSLEEVSYFEINDNDALTNLTDFPSLRRTSHYASINGNASLSSFLLSSLDTVGTNLYIGENENLVSVSFPELKVTNRGYLRIENNASLEGFSFPNLERIGFNYISGDTYANRHLNHGLRVYRNHVLKNIDGFPKLGSVSNNFYIIENEQLVSLNNFQGLEIIGRNLEIKSNNNLQDCCSIQPILSEEGVANVVAINNNPSKCSSETEIIEECDGTLPDTDNDGIANVTDNCIDIPNPLQEDIDQDGVGTACDCDETPETGSICSTGCETFYIDNDGDGFGTLQDSVVTCVAPAGFADNALDCDDTDENRTEDCTVMPEVNGTDENCNLGNGLLAYYTFDGNANDKSGNNHNANPVGNPSLTAGVDGTSNSAYNFDGDDYFIPEGQADFKFKNQSVTFSTWVTLDNNENSYQTFISNIGGDHRPWMTLYKVRSGISQGRIAFVIINENGEQFNVYSLQNGSELPKNEWLHVVGTLDMVAKQIKIYINGILQSTMDLPDSYSYDYNAVGQSELRIGNWYRTAVFGGRHKGNIDNVRVYARSLSEVEIQALYECENEVTIIDEDNDGVASNEDCDDASETGVNCSTDCQIFYRDGDRDGYGDANNTTEACTAPAGFVNNSDDCNDTEANINPTTEEIEDGIDNNCDGQIDEGFGDDPISTICTGNLTFTSQAEVDAFDNNCQIIEGDIIINGDDIEDLSPLESIIEVSGSLIIGDSLSEAANDLLRGLEGLNNIRKIDGDLLICNNPMLRSLGGLSSLEEVGGSIRVKNCITLEIFNLIRLTTVGRSIYIFSCPLLVDIGATRLTSLGGGSLIIQNCISLISFSGFSGLTYIAGDFYLIGGVSVTTVIEFRSLIRLGGCLHIIGNTLLESLEGLDGLEETGDVRLENNTSIPNVDEFENLRTINGSLVVRNNRNLFNLNGFSNLVFIRDSLVVTNNTDLAACCGLFPILNTNNVNGVITITANPMGCSSVADILETCGEPSLMMIWYEDADEDGFGNALVFMDSETAPEGFVDNATDCDDNNPLINPDAVDVLGDGVDNDCDGTIDNCICNTEFAPVCGADGVTYSNACEATCNGVTITSDMACDTGDDGNGGDEDEITLTCPPDITVEAFLGESRALVQWALPTVSTTCTEGICSIDSLNGFDFIGVHNGNLYYLSEDTLNWNQAKTMSEENGGHLVVINDANENRFISQAIGFNQSVLIGLNDAETEGDFVWLDGTNPTYTNWETGQPDNLDDHHLREDYAVLHGWSFGQWADYNFYTRKHFILEIECAGSIQNELEITQISGSPNASFLALGTQVITYQATDVCGNQATCSFNVTVEAGKEKCEELTNLALNQTARQSSTRFDASADLAVDGNTDGDLFLNRSVMHTEWENNPWWEVDLGASYQISELRLANRTDCCGAFLSDFYVLVSDTPFVTADLNSALNQSGIIQYYQEAAVEEAMTIGLNHTGRYVRIQMNKASFLALAEVEVMGCSSIGLQSGQTGNLVRFEGYLDKNNQVSLYGANRAAIAVESFTIEKKNAEEVYEVLEEREENSAAQQLVSFSAQDSKPLEGENIYRLKTTYQNGTFEYAPLVNVPFNPARSFELFPNPTDRYVDIYLQQFMNKEVDIVLFNSLGQEMYRWDKEEIVERFKRINVSEVKDGLYFITVIDQGKAISRRLIISHL